MLINLPSLDNVELPDYIGNSFLVTQLKEIKELDLSENIKGSIQLLYLKKAKRITFHSEECNEIYFPYLEDYNELELPKIVHGDLGLNSLIFLLSNITLFALSPINVPVKSDKSANK